MMITQARVPTANGSKYMQQLCKHWSHSLPVEFDAQRGEVRFPADMRGTIFPGEGKAIMTADGEGLLVELSGHSSEQMERLKLVVASHLDRFAFREAPLAYDWQAVEG